MEREGESVVLCAGRKAEKGYENARAAVLGPNSVLVGLLTMSVRAASEVVTVWAELAHFVCELGVEALVYL